MKQEKNEFGTRLLYLINIVGASLLELFFIWNATRNIIDDSYTTNEQLGIIKNGRLCACGNANTLGALVLFAILSSLYLMTLVERNSRYKIAYNIITIICLAINMTTLSLCRTRGVIVALFISFLLFFSICSYRNKSIRPIIKGAFTLSMLLIFVVFAKKLYDYKISYYYEETYGEESRNEIDNRLEAYSFSYELGTLTDRTLIWEATLNSFIENPKLVLTGVTPVKAKKSDIVGVYEGRAELASVHSHNGYIQLIYVYGVFGGAIGIMLLFVLVKECFLLEDKRGIALVLAILILGVIEIYPFPLYGYTHLGLLFFMMAGNIKQNRSLK